MKKTVLYTYQDARAVAHKSDLMKNTFTNAARQLGLLLLTLLLTCGLSQSLSAQAFATVDVMAQASCDDANGMQAAERQYYITVTGVMSDSVGNYTVSIDGMDDQVFIPGTTTALTFGPFTYSPAGGGGQEVSATLVGNNDVTGFMDVPEVLCGVTPDGGQASGGFCMPTTDPGALPGTILAQSAPGTFMAGGSSGQVQTYVLVDSDGIIVQSNLSGFFTGLPSDTFQVYAVNARVDEIPASFLLPGTAFEPVLLGRNDIDGDSGLDGACYTICGEEPMEIFVPLNCLSIGSVVFTDNDDDATFEPLAGEMGIPNVDINLFAESTPGSGIFDSLVATTMTATDGTYFFGGLDEGDYVVSIPTAPNGFPLSSTDPVMPTDMGTGDNMDNGIQTMPGGSVVSPTITLTAQMEPLSVDEPGAGGEQDDNVMVNNTTSDDDANGDMTVDFGFSPALSIGSQVFYDTDNSGDQDPLNPLETGIEDITVLLYQDTSTAMDGSGFVIVDSTVTDMDGIYLFDTLPAGNYQVAILTPADAPLASSGPAVSDTEDVDGNSDGITTISIVPGTPAAGDTIRSGTVVLFPMTESEGETFPGGDQDDMMDGNGNMTVDFGLVPQNSIGSLVFTDMNDNGIQDAGNPLDTPIEGVILQLLADVNGDGIPETVVAMDTTDADGTYFFGNLPDGIFEVQILMPDGSAATPSSVAGGDDQDDLIQNGTFTAGPGSPVSSGPIELMAGEEPLDADEMANAGGMQDVDFDANGDMTVDFGFVPMLSIGSTVFYDVNDNGTQDLTNPLETGIEGVFVTLFLDVSAAMDGSELVQVGTTNTDENGNYLFTMLPEGNYVVSVLPNDNAQTSSTDPGTGGLDNQTDLDDNGMQVRPGRSAVSPSIMLSAGDEPVEPAGNPGAAQDDLIGDLNGDGTIDFGFVPDHSIGSTVFYDPDDDGLQDLNDPTEGGIEGVAIQLFADLDGDGIAETLVGRDTTDENGNYFFGMLPPGDYQVAILNPSDAAPNSSTDPATAGDNQTDLNDDGTQLVPGGEVRSPIVNLSAGDEPIEDENNPGAGQDDGDDPDEDGIGNDDEDGDMTIDFGFVPNLSIGSTVFYDLDGDGAQDADNPLESGIDGVLVLLSIDTSDAMDGSLLVVIDSVLTDPDGNYLFDTLPEGNYVVSVVPADDAPTSPMTESGLDDDVDGVDDGIQLMPGDTTRSPLIMLTAGDEPGDEPFQGGTQDDGIGEENGNQTIDFAFVPNQSIGSTVFFDMDDNGMQDADDPQEMGIPNVTVQLLADLNGDGTIDQSEVVATTTTDDMGNYLFDSLPSGDYQLLIPMVDDAAMNSSTDIATSGDDNQTDGDDNGIQLVPGGAVLSPVITLSPGDEPVGDAEDGQGGDQDDGALTDANGDMTVDFGFVPMLSVGSTVFYDVDDNGVQDDDNPLETGIEDVQVFLVQVLEDAAGMDSLVVIDSVLTDDMGNYLFDSLSPGDYQIQVNVTPEDAQTSSAGSTPADDDVDSVDDGDQDVVGGPVTTATFTLSVGDEPAGDDEDGQGGNQDDGPDDLNGNMTIDLGFVPDLSVGSTVFF